MLLGAGSHPDIGSPFPSNRAQLRAISSSIRAQLLAALQGGCVAGDTLRHSLTRSAAAADPMSAAHDKRCGAEAAVATFIALAVCGASSASGLATIGAAASLRPSATSGCLGAPHAAKPISAQTDGIHASLG
ncbi:hypothetical protein BF95_22765 [Sphingobium sp. Ant17]|nr:hypothetical protein BF95_22765 [Sphingobium sp. Ant17]